MEICSSTLYSRICRKCGHPTENGVYCTKCANSVMSRARDPGMAQDDCKVGERGVERNFRFPGVANCSRISGFQYVTVVNGQADRPCAVPLVCVAD